jgi:AcrR family transcriptional regulator
MTNESEGRGELRESTRRPGAPQGNRQRLRTRAALLSAGQQLFARRHVDSVTIDDIVGAADVAKGSFYNHFDDKIAFAQEIIELVQGDVEFHIFSANQEITDPPMRIVRALCTVMRYAAEHPERLQALLSLAARGTDDTAPLNTGMVADIRHGLEQKRLRDIESATAVLVVIGLTNVAVTHLMSGHASSAVTLATDIGVAMLKVFGLQEAEARELAAKAAADLLPEESK